MSGGKTTQTQYLKEYSNMSYAYPKQREPQIRVEGEFQQLENSDIIVFEFKLMDVLLVTCLVTVPPEGQTRAPVYIKPRVIWPDGKAYVPTRRFPFFRRDNRNDRNDNQDNDQQESGQDQEL
jgi:hypothetical protein